MDKDQKLLLTLAAVALAGVVLWKYMDGRKEKKQVDAAKKAQLTSTGASTGGNPDPLVKMQPDVLDSTLALINKI